MKKTLSIAALLALVSASAWAADRPAVGQGGDFLRHWDTNGDGMVTRDEAQAAASEHAGKRFDALDQDKDGVLTKEELQKMREAHRTARQERMTEHFNAADTNGDGSLSREEVEKGMPRLTRAFDRLDTDGDGVLSREEMEPRGRGFRLHPSR